MLTDFKIEYMFNIMENDLKTAKAEYEAALKNDDTPFTDILKLAKRKNAREHVMYLVRNAIANGMAEALE